MKAKNIIIAVIAVLIVGVGVYYFYPVPEEENIGGEEDEHGCMLMAGYSWCEAEQKCLRPWEEGCEDYITQLFEAVETETNIDFSEPVDVVLTWQVESETAVESLTLDALMISADTVVDQDFQKIKNLIENDGFEDDAYNGRGSFVGESRAYRKDNFSLVCVLSGILSDFDLDEPRYEPQTTDRDVNIICAILDKSLVPEISVEKRIREALAEKHGKKVSQTEITITQETEDHARGSVVFQPGGSENSGMFLAANVNGEWQIAFDGNGAVACQDLEDYNFPSDMVEDVCY